MDLIRQPSSRHSTNQMTLYAMAPFVGVLMTTGLLVREFRHSAKNFRCPKISHNSTTQMLFCAMVLIIGVLIVPGHKRSATSFLDQSYDPFNNHTHTSPKKHLAKKFHYVVMNFKCTTILHNGATQMLSCVKAVSKIHYFTTNFLCPSFQISNSVQMIVCAWALCIGVLIAKRHNGHPSVDTFNVGRYAFHDRHCILIDLVIRYMPFARLVIGYMPSMWITIAKVGFTRFSLSSWEATWDLLMTHVHRSLMRSILAANQGLFGVFHGWHCNPFNSHDIFKHLVLEIHYFCMNFLKANFPIGTTVQVLVCALALCASWWLPEVDRRALSILRN